MIGLIAFIGIYFLILAYVAYVMICGNNKVHRDGFVGKSYQFLSETIPNICTKITPKCCQCGEREECLGQGGKFRYIITIFFYFIYIFFSASYLLTCYPLIDKFMDHPELHKILAFLVLPGPWIIFIIFQIVDPGVINADNVNGYLQLYPYDRIIYGPRICPTEHIPIVPRSRYCKYTHRRVANYDHYCPWVLGVVGERTHRFFLLFLLTCIIAAGYYGYADIKYIIYRYYILTARMRWRGTKFQNFMNAIATVLSDCPVICGSSFALVVITITLVIFLGQQIYYASINVNQIEIDKFELAKEVRASRGITEPIKNIYDKGFWANWKQCLFPPRPPKCEKYVIPDEDSQEIQQEEQPNEKLKQQ